MRRFFASTALAAIVLALAPFCGALCAGEVDVCTMMAPASSPTGPAVAAPPMAMECCSETAPASPVPAVPVVTVHCQAPSTVARFVTVETLTVALVAAAEQLAGERAQPPSTAGLYTLHASFLI